MEDQEKYNDPKNLALPHFDSVGEFLYKPRHMILDVVGQ